MIDANPASTASLESSVTEIYSKSLQKTSKISPATNPLHPVEDQLNQCSECGKICASKAIFKRHSLAHSNANPHQCVSCGRTYKYRRNLKQHEKLTHSDCTSRNTVLKYACQLCDKRFARKPVLDDHMETHLGRKHRPFLCSSCGRKFTRSSTMFYHQRQFHSSQNQ
ncbi:Myc-associated zinc finger protein [Clonorchis sinensis]|uniref:Myc-associated zinc finger protein n=1 Tax=Clonorchis sinensis TaxID=79923 RepID=A0A8T1N217_CLOSI|nr:Myc-associated zinc finger protein [Clonorchis sinensis]